MANEQLKELKLAEQQQQKKYYANCAKVMAMLKDKRKDFVLESLSQIDASVGAISTDVQAFKNIRNYLFQQITEDIHKHKNELSTLEERKNKPTSHKREDSQSSEAHKAALTKNKLYLYLFHLFESIVNHVAQLIQKTHYTILSQCGESVN